MPPIKVVLNTPPASAAKPVEMPSEILSNALAEWVYACTPAIIEGLTGKLKTLSSGSLQDPKVHADINWAAVNPKILEYLGNLLEVSKRHKLEYEITFDERLEGDPRQAEFSLTVTAGNLPAAVEVWEGFFKLHVPLPDSLPGKKGNLLADPYFRIIKDINTWCAGNFNAFPALYGRKVYPLFMMVDEFSWSRVRWSADEVNRGSRVSYDLTLIDGAPSPALRVDGVNALIDPFFCPGLPKDFAFLTSCTPLLIEARKPTSKEPVKEFVQHLFQGLFEALYGKGPAAAARREIFKLRTNFSGLWESLESGGILDVVLSFEPKQDNEELRTRFGLKDSSQVRESIKSEKTKRDKLKQDMAGNLNSLQTLLTELHEDNDLEHNVKRELAGYVSAIRAHMREQRVDKVLEQIAEHSDKFPEKHKVVLLDLGHRLREP